MSRTHPLVAVTGSSGAGTTTIRTVFERLFAEQDIRAAFVHGDSFHRYTRDQLNQLLEAQPELKSELSHFALQANLLTRLEGLFQSYAETGRGQCRHYVHAEDHELIQRGYVPGNFTPWQDLPEATDLLLYEGLHGGLVTSRLDLAQYVDLLIGIAPSINLEWIQKISRDTQLRGYSQEAVVDSIQARMEDYLRYILPQFSRTHINFQRVPMVDTSNPLAPQAVPTAEESLVVIHFRQWQTPRLDYLQTMMPGSFISRPDTLVIPGTQMELALELILLPEIMRLLAQARS